MKNNELLNLMKHDASETFTQMIFNNAKQSEKLIVTDFNNNVLFTESGFLGQSFIKLINCGTALIEDAKEQVINYPISPKTGESLKDILKKIDLESILNDEHLLCEAIDIFETDDTTKKEILYSRVKLLYDELMNISTTINNKDYLLKLGNLLKNGYIKISKQHILFWYSLSYDDVYPFSRLSYLIERINDYNYQLDFEIELHCEELFVQLLEQLKFLIRIINFYKEYINYIDNFCCLEYRDYLDKLNNMQRAYLYFSNNETEDLNLLDIKYGGIFSYNSKKALTAENYIAFNNLSEKERARAIKENEVNMLECIAMDNMYNFANAYITKILEQNIKIKRCKNCNRYFIPFNRSDTMFCDEVAPQNLRKTCKEYAAQELYYKKIKANPANTLHRKIYQQKQMLAKRNPDIEQYKADFEDFKLKSKTWRNKIKQGIETEENYMNWLNGIKEKRDNNGND